MTELPAVPIPPTDLSAPHDASVVFLVICSVIMAVAVVYVARRALRGDWMGVLFLAGGLLAGVLEPMLDYLGLLWFAADNVAIAVETFHRHVPLYVVMGYAFYFGGSSYIAYRAMLAGRGTTWFWGFFAFDWLADLALQATGQALGLYEYYGPQPLLIFDVPAWWFTIDASLPVLCGGAVFLMRHHLNGLAQAGRDPARAGQLRGAQRRRRLARLLGAELRAGDGRRVARRDRDDGAGAALPPADAERRGAQPGRLAGHPASRG